MELQIDKMTVVDLAHVANALALSPSVSLSHAIGNGVDDFRRMVRAPDPQLGDLLIQLNRHVRPLPLRDHEPILDGLRRLFALPWGAGSHHAFFIEWLSSLAVQEAELVLFPPKA